jgi:hypothetical protein
MINAGTAALILIITRQIRQLRKELSDEAARLALDLEAARRATYGKRSDA